jgi:hypothetical protein
MTTSDQAKEMFLTHLHQQGYQLVDPYINTQTKVTVQCPRGHQYETLPNSFTQGHYCRICKNWKFLQQKTFKSPLKRQSRLFRFAQKHQIPYTIPKPDVSFTTRAEACQVLKCEPAQAFMARMITTHDLPWDISLLQQYVIALEKWKYATYPDLIIQKHSQTIVGLVLYWYGQTHCYHIAQTKVAAWVGVTGQTIRNWWKRFHPFFKNL